MSDAPFYPYADPGQARVKPWAIDSQHLRSTTLDLSTPRDNYELKISGDFLWIGHTTFGAAQISINLRQDAVGLPGIKMKRGSSIAGVKFDSIFISNDSQQGVITIVYGQEIGNNIRIDNYIDDGISYIDDTYYTLNKNAFFAYRRFAPTAGKYAHVSFLNNTTASKIVITSCKVMTEINNTLIIGSNKLYTAANIVSNSVGALLDGSDITNSVQIATGSEPAPEISVSATNFLWRAKADEYFEIVEKNTIILSPASALAFCANTVDADLEIKLEGYIL